MIKDPALEEAIETAPSLSGARPFPHLAEVGEGRIFWNVSSAT